MNNFPKNINAEINKALVNSSSSFIAIGKSIQKKPRGKKEKKKKRKEKRVK